MGALAKAGSRGKHLTDAMKRKPHTLCLLLLLSAALVLGAAAEPALGEGIRPIKRSKRAIKEDLRYAAKMAEQGLWREALFRWERVLRQRSDDARILNNIAVAREVTGDLEGAREAYELALAIEKSSWIDSNFRLFLRAQEQHRHFESGGIAPRPLDGSPLDGDGDGDGNE